MKEKILQNGIAGESRAGRGQKPKVWKEDDLQVTEVLRRKLDWTDAKTRVLKLITKSLAYFRMRFRSYDGTFTKKKRGRKTAPRSST